MKQTEMLCPRQVRDNMKERVDATAFSIFSDPTGREGLADRLHKSVCEFVRKVAERGEIVSFRIPGNNVFSNARTSDEVLSLARSEIYWAFTWPDDQLKSPLAAEWYELNRVLIAEFLLSAGC